MNYECQEHYEHEMGAAGAAEAEAAAGYEEYLNQLGEQKEYYLLAHYIAIDILNSKPFKDSGLSPVAYLEQAIHKMTQPKPDNSVKPSANTPIDDDLPF